ncbi:ATP-binding protein [Acidobacterium sp. S8]|uniref:ATP-binding protein n=1 Tax=Acidobacterium sp. S8 TaxID=1641854 RepID=UPI0020B176E9|nr:ATP-binding protein [Acidobacterium sp. S8]
MKFPLPTNLRGRLTFWYVSVLAVLLFIYAAMVFAFQYAVLSRQLFHDEVQDVITAEGLLFFDTQGTLRLRDDYFSRPQSHLLLDRMMEVRDLSGNVLYRSATLKGMPLGGPNRHGEGDTDFDARIVRLQDGSHAFVVSHIHSMQGRTMLIRLGYSLVPLRDRMFQFFVLLLIAILLALMLAAVAGQMIAKRALRPLHQMATRAEGITASNLNLRLAIENPADELGYMARVFNHLLDRLEQAFNQLQRFTADAAHELRTPIAALQTIGEVALEKGQGSTEYQEALGSILEETGRLNETIESLLLLARAEAAGADGNKTIFAVSELVNEVLGLLEVIIEERKISVTQEGESVGRAYVRANRSLLRIAIVNILHNSLKFSPNESVLSISYSRIEAVASQLQVTFQDQGPGITPGEHQQVFERFFTSPGHDTATKSGSGLGLSVAKLVIDRIGGEIRFDQKVQVGAKCIVNLPISE